MISAMPILLFFTICLPMGELVPQYSSCFPFCDEKQQEVPDCFPFCHSSHTRPATARPATARPATARPATAKPPISTRPANCTEPVVSKSGLSERKASTAGRHLLLLTLLEDLNQPVSVPRGINREVSFKLPPALRSESSLQFELDESEEELPCCQLKDVPGLSRSGGSLTLKDLLSECERAGVLAVERGRHLNLFNNAEKQLVTNLADILLSRSSFEDLLTVSCAVRDQVNQELFRQAMVQVATRRGDLGMLMPMSTEFLPTNFVSGARQTIQEQAAQGVCPVLDMNRNEPPYQTYPDSEPESQLWYFREDPQMNSHHNYWHGLFSNKSLERRGEFFFYMHRQMVIRYNVERLTHNMGVTPPLSPDTWDKPIPLGYDAKLKAEIGKDYVVRPYNIPMVDLTGKKGGPFGPQKVSVLKTWYKEIQTAIRNGRIDTENGPIPLGSSEGRDEGVSVFGDLVEALGSVNPEKYGDIHNQGHIFMGFITDPAGTDQSQMGVMANPATNVRDPVFFRWHQMTDDLFTDYKSTLPPYTEGELGFPGVKILSSQVSTGGRRNVLQTKIAKQEFLLHGSTVGVKESYVARYNILNHEPFQYKIVVDSKWSNIKAKVRIFLIPNHTPNPQSPQAVEMDRFLVRLKKGSNTITRESSDSTVVGKRQATLLELQEDFAHNNITEPELELFDGCGWPPHLLVPKGTSRGNRFDLIVVLSNLLRDDAAHNVDPEKVSKSSFVHCGMPGGTIMPDSRPMGFPFDRPVTWRMPENMAKTSVKIFHRDV